jgi:hypothetical protein
MSRVSTREAAAASSHASVPPSGSGSRPLYAALVAVLIGLLLFRLGSGHTMASRRFVGRPQFDVFSWVMAAEMSAAAGTGAAILPTVKVLARATGRHAIIKALAAWGAAGLFVLLGPRALPERAGFLPLWLLVQRVTVATVVVGLFVTPSFIGLMLVQARLSALKLQMTGEVAGGRAGQVVAELSWLRGAMSRFLSAFALVISGSVLAAGVLRLALLADGLPPEKLPALGTLIYGASFTALSALIFFPAYIAWQERVAELREELYPFPENERPAHSWYEGRSDYDALLSVSPSAGRTFRATFTILAPFIGSLLSAIAPR